MPETFSPLQWRNDQSPALNEVNLNRLEAGVEVLDDRIARNELGIVDPVTVPYATSVTLNATQGSLFRCIATGDLTLDDIIGGTDGQNVAFEVLASGAARSLAFTGSVDSVSIPSGQWWAGTFRFVASSNTWLLSDPGGSGGASSGGSSATPADGSITDVKVATTAAISLDKTADTANRIAMAPGERAKLNGVASGATANATNAALRDRSTHTGTQPVSSLAASGTPSSTTFLRGDGVWSTLAGGGATVSARGAVSILDHGGVADSATPNDAAWAAVRAEMDATGLPGYLPGNTAGIFSGAYAFANPMDILAHNREVFGDGPERTTIRGLDPTKPVVRMGGERTYLRDMTIMHSEAPTSTMGAGIELYKLFLGRLDNLMIYRTGWGVTVPDVNADSVFPGIGGGNYAFSYEMNSVRVLRAWMGAMNLKGFNAANTGSVVRNTYFNNEDGSSSTTTLTADVAIGANTCSMAVAPVPGQVIYIDTAGTVECRSVVSVAGTAPYTVTLNETFLAAHATGASVLLSNKYRAHQNVLRVTLCDEMVFDQFNVEGVLVDGNAIQFQDTNTTIRGLHFERVNCQGWESALIRVYGADTVLNVDSMVVAFCDFRKQTSDLNRSYLSLDQGGSAHVRGLTGKGNKVETGINMRLARWTSVNNIGTARLTGIDLDQAVVVNGTYSPQGTNLRTGQIFDTAYTVGDNADLPRLIELNERRYRWQNVNGREHVWGTAAPTAGTWAVGDTVHNSAPTPGGTLGWVCTTAGTPGTWKAMPSLAA